MKNLKKVLAMVLAFACTFSMFAGAKVFEDVPAGSDYSEAVTMLSDLGIIQGKDDGKYHPEDTITRAEACAMIARLMTGDPNVSQYVGAQSFTDVAKGSWKDSAIGYCYINGIVIGVGNNKFEPDRAITDAEFVTMVVRAMGYETADMKQNYPYSYMSNAQAIGLLDGTNMVASTDALRGEDAQVIYNALFADYARGAKLVNTTHGTSVEQYPTLAESVWGLTRAAVGEWKEDKETGADYMSTCKAHTWVVTGNVVEIGKVNYVQALPIEDGETSLYEIKDADDEVIENAYYFQYEGDVDSIKGYQVELWGQGDHSEPEYTTVEVGDKKVKGYIYSSDWDIKAIKTVKGQSAYDYNATMDDEKTNGSIETDSIDVDLDNVQNSSLSDKKLEEALNVKNSASYKLIDWDSDGSVDFITSTGYSYYEVDAVSSKTVRLIAPDGKTKITLDLDGETKFDDGEWVVKAEFPDDLAEGDIIEVSSDVVSGKKEITETWTVKVVEPETKDVTEVDTKKGVEFDDELIKVADKEYTFATDGEKAYDTYDNMDEDTDIAWDLWRDANGFIIKMQPSDSSTGYLFVTGYDEGENKTGDRSQMVVSGVYGDNTEAKDVKLVNNAAIYLFNDKDAENVYDKDTHKLTTENVDKDNDGKTDSKVEHKDIAGHAYRYTANEDGEITKLVRVATDETANDYSFDEDTDVLKDKENKTAGKDTNLYLDEAKVIFAVDADAATEWSADGATDEMSTGDVLAVEYKDVPSIGEGEKTDNDDLQYDLDSDKETITAAVLGVNTFRYFGNTTNKSGLVTKMSYKPSSDTYEIEATLAGETETEFKTIDADDVDMNNGASNFDLDDMYDLLTKGSDAKNGLYAEMDFNADGEIIAIDLMTDTYENLAAVEDAKTDGIKGYGVARVVINRVSSQNRILTSQAISNGDGKVYTNSAQTLEQNFDITDDTKFYEIDADLEFPTNGKMLNAYTDAFADEFRLADIDEGDVNDLDSFIRTETDDDEYVVADVIYDDGDAVAVYYYKDTVAEAKVKDAIVVDDVTIDITGETSMVTKQYDYRTIGDAVVDTDKAPVVSPADKKVSAEYADGKIQISVDNGAMAGDYKVTLFAKDGKTEGTFTVTVKSDVKSEMDVKDADELAAALANEDVTTINLKADIELDSALTINRAVTINGNGHSLDKNVVIGSQGKNVTLNDVEVNNNEDAYAVQVYDTYGVTLNNVTATSSKKGAILINGSTVKLTGTTTVDGAWGGIEVSKGVDAKGMPELTVEGTLVNNSDGVVLWIDGYKQGTDADVAADIITADAVKGMDDYQTRVVDHEGHHQLHFFK